MTLERQVCLYVLISFLGGCTLPTVEEPEPVANQNSIVEIKFVESAPKDRFIITNIGSCVLEEITLDLDLSQSAGRLIFDTSATGAGVEVFQPFEVESGNITQLAADGVNDGDTDLSLRITTLNPGNAASFTIDVDDTLPAGELGQIRVADSEISGATVSLTIGDSDVISTTFDNGSMARANLPTCSLGTNSVVYLWPRIAISN
ncbi:MAG: aggregation factor core [Cyanobacteria bacterium P01_F01_bin.116]